MLRALGELVDAGRITPPAGFAIRFLFATGCRAGEVLDLRWEYVDLAAGVLRWPDSKTGAMVKPITDETAALLAGADRFVGVPWVAPGPSMSRMRIEYLADSFRKVMSAAGVEAGENATLHLIRHWFASTIYSDPAIPLPLAMRITGHSAVATAMRYAHATRDQVFYAAAGAAERRADAIRRAGAGAEIVPIKGGR
jgi:integrase